MSSLERDAWNVSPTFLFCFFLHFFFLHSLCLFICLLIYVLLFVFGLYVCIDLHLLFTCLHIFVYLFACILTQGFIHSFTHLRIHSFIRFHLFFFRRIQDSPLRFDKINVYSQQRLINNLFMLFKVILKKEKKKDKRDLTRAVIGSSSSLILFRKRSESS